MGFFNSSWEQSPLGKQLSNQYSGYLSQPNMGYDANQGHLLEGARAKSLDTSKNAIRNLYASMGQGMNSPQMLRSLSNAQGDINTAYDTRKFDDESKWRQQVMQGAGQAAQMGQYQPSGFATLMSPIMQGMGQSLGPKIGQGAADLMGKGFSSLVGGGQGLMNTLGGMDYSQFAPVAAGSGLDYGIGEEAASCMLQNTPGLWDTISKGFGSLFGYGG